MKQKFKTNTNTFSIAHYILLFFVVTLCICIIAWVIIFRHNPDATTNITKSENISGAYSCPQKVKKMVTKMWQNDSNSIPKKYWRLAQDFLNAPVASTTFGVCQDIAYTCHAGQIRSDCDPCAVISARAYAQEIQTIDMIGNICK
ncbi:MAG: hypothetical protein J6R22_03870 [Alphaproteobacteria bacterium]|nr:hypothetical protein [Alphaproteobacteria bacterium]